MAIKLFLLGRPGSGKTTAFHIIKKMVPKKRKAISFHAIRFREYTILREMVHQEGNRGKFRLVEHGGFDVLDFSVFYESARRLEEQIQSYLNQSLDLQKKEIIVIELARGDYGEAMNCFSSAFLKDAYFLFIDADLDTCIKRIQYRVAHPKKTDGHHVTDTIMKSYYAKNNLPYMDFDFKLEHGIQTRVTVIKNTGTLRKFAKETRRAAKTILALEDSENEEVSPRSFVNSQNPLPLFIYFIMASFLVPILLLPYFLFEIAKKIFHLFQHFMRRTASIAKTLYSHPARKSANPSSPAPETAYAPVSTPANQPGYAHALPDRG